MLDKIDLSKVLVFDIETVSGVRSYEELNPTMQKLWNIKSEQIQRRTEESERLSPEENFTAMAGIYAEFGKIVCISVGAFRRDKDSGEYHLHLKSYYSDDEKLLLEEFSAMLNKGYHNSYEHILCGHNIREFDVPYICRRLIIKRMPLPALLDIQGKKPWETKHLLDTLDMWKFGDYKNYTSLKLLCGVFDIPTPKDDIDGSEVGRTYWQEDDLKRIEVYCKKDVLATAQLLLRYKLMDLLRDEQVHDADEKASPEKSEGEA